MNPKISELQGHIYSALYYEEATREQIQLLEDGVHSFAELYQFRAHYNALAFKALHLLGAGVYKSKLHNDGTSIAGFFVVGFEQMDGQGLRQFTNHYPLELWDLFQIPEAERMPFEFDGHNSQDTLERIERLIQLLDWYQKPRC